MSIYDATIKKSIINKLSNIEQLHNVKILLAIESGSRGWGFAAANADYDCRFIYAHKTEKYLSILEMDEFIDYELNETFDIRGYDLKRVLKYIMKSQATINEWLSSNVIYINNGPVTKKLSKLAADFFNPIPVSYHYLSLAKKMLAEITVADEAKIKKYFYILRPIANLNYIQQYGKMPYMEYDKTLGATTPPSGVATAIQALKKQKAALLEHDKIPQHMFLIDYFNSEISRFESVLKEMKHEKNTNYTPLDEAFREIIEEVWK